MKSYLGVVDTTGKILRDVTDSNGLPVSLTGRNAVDAQTLWTPGMLYNGTTSDIPRGNTQGTLLASAARTATAQSAIQTNYNARGVQIVLNITVASGTGGLQVICKGYDPITGGQYWLNNGPTAITATGMYAYEMYPGASTAAIAGAGIINQRTATALPRTWGLHVIHVDTTSYTYSVGYSLIL